MNHYLKLGNSTLFLLLLFLVPSCEKEIQPSPEVLPVYEIMENINSNFDPISELTSTIYSTVVAYPNPFSNSVNIYSHLTPDQIIISDSDGNLKKFEPGSNNSAFDFSNGRPGVYYCEVIMEGRAVRLQLFKTKN
jgi:hypothetical protein